MKKELIIVIILLFIMPLVLAQNNKIEVSTVKENYISGENITLKVTLLDSQNNPVNAETILEIQDGEKRVNIEKTVQSNKLVEIDLGTSAPSGYWTIKAKYLDSTAIGSFMIKSNEEVKFELVGDMLTVTNIGNTRYSKTIQIVIGETIGIKDIDLDIGEKISFRLIAPEGIYNIKVTDGTNTFTRGSVSLTGEAIGILDERLNQRTPITSVGPENIEESSSYSIFKQNKIIYILVLAIVGATILLGIERYYKRKSWLNYSKNKLKAGNGNRTRENSLTVFSTPIKNGNVFHKRENS